MRISEITRRDIIDAIQVENVRWAGRLEETEFLSRLFDLTILPSTDRRFNNAEGDIWQHRVINPEDWEEDWIFYDERFNLFKGDDQTFLNFLCETIHPVVRPNVIEAERLSQLYNSFLEHDGFQLIERARLSGRPIFSGHYIGSVRAPAVSVAKETLSGSDLTYVAQQITRMEAAVYADPSLAIGTAKELIETCCKTILTERGAAYSDTLSVPQLVKLTCKELKLTPDDIKDEVKAGATIKRILSNMATITQGLAELRNEYGTGHGKNARTKGLSPRHAKLAVGAASTLAVFLVETHRERDKES